jgi:outer membrane protein assembly factor BamB
VIVLLLIATLVTGQGASTDSEALRAAARSGDRAQVQRLLDAGVAVDAATRYQQTPLLLAAERGHADVVSLLLSRGANVNQRDSFYGMRPLDVALSGGHLAVARLLVEQGASDAAAALLAGIRGKDVALVKAALASPSLDVARMASAVAAAETAGDASIAALVKEATARVPATAVFRPDPAALGSYVGAYANDDSRVTVTDRSGSLVLQPAGGPEFTLVPRAPGVFAAPDLQATVTFSGSATAVERVTIALQNRETSLTLTRVNAAAAPAARAAQPAPAAGAGGSAPGTAAVSGLDALRKPSPPGAARPWPGFRGPNASGNGDGQGAPVEWDVPARRNVRWRTSIPGFANASPVIYGDRVYVVTAINSGADRTFRTGNYGDVAPVNDLSEHTWKVYALDAGTGAIVWERDVYRGAPKTKRHPKATQANATPVTDGRRIVSVFGAIGLVVAHDVSGKELWRRDVGVIDSGWFFDADVQWGHASSPVIYEDTVVLLADQQTGSFLAAYDLDTGREMWRTPRTGEIPTWGTPVIARAASGDEIVTNGTKVRGYDAKSGKLLWDLGPNSEITVGTPVVDAGLVFVTGGYPPVRPIYAIKVGSRGNLTLPAGATTSAAIPWSNDRDGTYIPSPIVYRGLLYVLNNNGILTAFNRNTGERVLRTRIGSGGAFSASPVAADGRLYIASEDGDVFVVAAGAPEQLIARNPVGEVVMATPAISNGLVVIRTLGGVVAVSQP